MLKKAEMLVSLLDDSKDVSLKVYERENEVGLCVHMSSPDSRA
jgi:hypothetical protein